MIALTSLLGAAFLLPFFSSSPAHSAFSLRVRAGVMAAPITMIVIPMWTHPMRKRLLHWMLFRMAA